MKNEMPDIVRGHEIWLEYESQHVEVGKRSQCRLFFGHNLALDGNADVEKIKTAIIGSNNQKVDIPLTGSNGDMVINFEPGMEGDHIVVAEYDAGIWTVTNNDTWHFGPKKEFENVRNSGYYYQYAKTIMPGYGIEMPDAPVGHQLEIISDTVGHLHIGDTVNLKIFYKGAPLTQGVLVTTCSGNKGNGNETPINPDGTVAVILDAPGNWMFKVQHADQNYSVEDEYDEMIYTSVFTIMSVH